MMSRAAHRRLDASWPGCFTCNIEPAGVTHLRERTPSAGTPEQAGSR
jgi:hypothetical protein